jgi:hypothetical protein
MDHDFSFFNSDPDNSVYALRADISSQQAPRLGRPAAEAKALAIARRFF